MPNLHAEFFDDKSRVPTILRAIRGLAAAAVLLVTGCQAPPLPTGPTALTLDVDDYGAFVDDSLSRLRRYDFPPKYVDRSRGLIITQPATGGQWFEPWRVDTRGAYQTLESNLHTVRRTVTVQLDPLDTSGPTTQPASGRYRLSVQVDKARFSAPERQVTTASGALSIYSERLPTTEGLRGPRSRQETWVPLGRDVLLEGFLLGELARVAPARAVVAEEP